MHHEPIPERASNGQAEFDAIWWPSPNGNGHTHSSRPAPTLHDVAEFGHDSGTAEIWGTPGVLRAITPRPVDGLTSDEIWGPPRLTAPTDFPVPDSVWAEQPNERPIPATPTADHQRPFALPDTWAASPRRPRWRKRLDSFGYLSRRTG